MSLKVFIDFGHDTIKCCQVSTPPGLNYNVDSSAKLITDTELQHFEIPTLFVPQLVKKSHIDFDFKKQKIDQHVDQITKEQLISLTPEKQLMQRGLFCDAEKGPFQTLKLLEKVVNFLAKHNTGRMPFIQQNKDYQEQSSVSQSYDFTLLMTEGSLTMAGANKELIKKSLRQREQLCEIVMETLQVSKFGLTPAQAPMLFSQMLHTGYVVDFGHEMTQIVPIENGHVIYNDCCVLEAGGKLIDLIQQRHIDGLQDYQRENPYFGYIIRREIKEKLSLRINKAYVLPDGQKVYLSSSDSFLNAIECYFSDNVLQHYQKWQQSQYGIHEAPPVDSQFGESSLLRKISSTLGGSTQPVLLTGGASQFQKIAADHDQTKKCVTLSQITQAEITDYLPNRCFVAPDPRLSVLQGGRIMLELESIEKMLIDKREYEEHGSGIVNWKCI